MPTATRKPPHSPPTTRAASDTRYDSRRLYGTKNDLPEVTRIEVTGLLNQRLAEAIDLATQCKQAHWNIKGPSFISSMPTRTVRPNPASASESAATCSSPLESASG